VLDNVDVCCEQACCVPLSVVHCGLDGNRVLPLALDDRHARQAAEAEHADAEPDDPEKRENARDDRGVP
jgi:hypothetical protein